SLPAADGRTGPAATLTVAGLSDKVAVWFEAGGQTRFHWAAESYPELARRIRRLRRLCSLGAPTGRISSEARALYRLLLPDGTGQASQVYVRARGVFEMIPLATFLLAGEGSSATFSFQPFGEQMPPAASIPPSHVRMTMIAATNVDPTFALPALPD